jgi:NitT/TauT family transport system substrate-binding protein
MQSVIKISRRQCLLGLAALSGTSLLAACAPVPAAAPAAPPTTSAAPANQTAGARAPLSPPVTVRYGTISIAPEAAVFIACERGYFRDEGLDVEFTQFTSGAEQTPLLATGTLHFGAGGPDPSVLNANTQNIGVKLVGHNSIATPEDRSAAFIVRKDLLDSGKVASAHDLKGLTVGVNIERTTSQL